MIETEHLGILKLVNGAHFKSAILNKMISSFDSSIESIEPLSACLIDLKLSEKYQMAFLDLILARLKQAKATCVNSTVYNLILMARRGDKEAITRKIFTYFSENDDRGSSEWNEILGSAIMQFSFAMRQDQDLGNIFLKILKGKNLEMNVFGVSLMLVISKVNRFEEQASNCIQFDTKIFDWFKSSLLKIFKNRIRAQTSIFTSQICPVPPTDPRQVFIDICGMQWDQVTESLIQLGFELINYQVTGIAANSVTSSPNHPVFQLRNLGSVIVHQIFKVNRPCRMTNFLGFLVLQEIDH